MLYIYAIDVRWASSWTSGADVPGDAPGLGAVINIDDPAGQAGPVGLKALAGHDQAKLVDRLKPIRGLAMSSSDP